jgi:energy-coupling factor transporter transmembrane protein EcfT
VEVLIHFVFELIKISILGCLYATIIIYLLKLIAKFKPNTFIEKILNRKKIAWFSIGFLFSISLFIFLFSYWGNHELGDSARIPIGYDKEISNINWTKYANFEGVKSLDGYEIYTTKFKNDGKILCGNYDSDFYDYKNSYFVYNLEIDQLTEFTTEAEYNTYAVKNGTPKTNQFLTFEDNYGNYWNGWRFWLLA